MNHPIRSTPRGFAHLPFFILLLVGSVQAREGYQMPPEPLAKLVDIPLTPTILFSPDREHFLSMEQRSLPSITELAGPELRLAGIRIDLRNNGPSRARSLHRLSLQTLDGDRMTIEGLPRGARIRNVEWSPDGAYVAFTHDSDDRIDLYVLDVAAAEVRRLMDVSIHAALGSPIEWLSDSRTLIARIVSPERGEPPEKPLTPAGPVIQETMDRKAPARTYQDLLQNEFDEALFTYYFTSQLVRVTVEGTVTQMGKPGIYYHAEPSPDGRYLLVESFHKPYSYLVPAYRFPHRIEVWDLDGNLVRHIDDLPLAEEVPIARGSVPTGIRSIAWRDDLPATLYWTEALDGGDALAEAEYRDQIYALDAPFSGKAVPLMKLPLRYAGVQWCNDELALVSESWWSTRTRRVYSVAPSRPEVAPRLVFDVSFEDRYNDPGQPMTQPTRQGRRTLITGDDGTSIFLNGAGASPEGNRPFLRRMNLETGEISELFRSEAPHYERLVTVLDADAMTIVTRRESTIEPPNYFLRDLRIGTLKVLTTFPHPYPELAEIQKETIRYTREDGITLSAELYLPVGYSTEQDGPLPALLWAYPREFKSATAAAQRTDSPFEFKWLDYWGAVPYVTQGYAVINNAKMPVVGEGDREPNDTFREQLVASAKAAIEEGVRRGVVDPNRVAIGGHSYGAFMTANLLAHSNLFRAGIARSGAYNRTLTPFGFQNEERIFWESPETYYQMSPFMHVDKVDEPILLIHGEADNNSGTFPLQSRRFYSALKGLGKTARLVILPHESHGYQARESILHMLWETNRWLEIYVKNALPRAESTRRLHQRREKSTGGGSSFNHGQFVSRLLFLESGLSQ